jgi:hypothetical protein
MVLSSPHHYDEYDDAHHDWYHRAAVVVVDVARYDDSLVTWQHPYCVMVLALRMPHWVEGYI